MYGISTPSTLARIHHSLLGSCSSFSGNLLLLYLLFWHESRHEKQKESGSAESSKMLLNTPIERPDYFQSFLYDYIQNTPQFDEYEPLTPRAEIITLNEGKRWTIFFLKHLPSHALFL
jgi:hypothetical protein